MNRRAYIGLCGATVATGLAGCSRVLSVPETAGQVSRIELTESQLSAAEYRQAAAESHETHDSGGVWGKAGNEPAHGLEFQGAWQETLSHGEGIESRHLLAMYRLPPGPEGTESSQVWLWSGIEPTEDVLAHRIDAGISLPSDAELGIYSPAQDVRADEVTEYQVESGRLDADTLGTTMPITSGQVSVDEETEIGDGGTYVAFWEGKSNALQSVAATTEVRWGDLEEAQLDWRLSAKTAP